MMDIVLFQEITTAEALDKLEAEGQKYQGLYVDMDDKEQRKYVKDNAALINDLLKKLDRARIDKSKAYKASVEAEAKEIRERLENANKPFTLLIGAHKEKRAAILAAEKAEAEAKALAMQIEADHETALMMDKIETIEKAEREQARLARDKHIADEAAERAVRQERERQIQQEKAEKAERLKREASRVHVSKVRTHAKMALISLGLDEPAAKKVILAINSGSIPNVTINY
jgi:hypothetical protein